MASAVLRKVAVTTTSRHATILLVDDDVELLKALTKVLEKEGFQVSAQPNAVRAMEQVTSGHITFQVVITDVSMPGLHGIEFLSKLKAAYPQVPVIIITAFGDWGQYMEALREGAYEYLSKPLDKNTLLATIHRALGTGVTG